jgi:aspartate/methionine/tyrosine aminotransferase
VVRSLLTQQWPWRGPTHTKSACPSAGAVHWGPPTEAIADAAAHATDPSYSSYGPDEGIPELRAAVQEKIERNNGLAGVRTQLPAIPTPQR